MAFTEDDYKAIFGKSDFSGLASAQAKAKKDKESEDKYKQFLSSGEQDPGDLQKKFGDRTVQSLIDEYNENGDFTKRKNYRKMVEDALNDPNNPDHELALILSPNLKKNAWENVNDFTAASNDALYGGLTRSAANTVNWLGSGFNGDEAERKTAEFMKTIGQDDGTGMSALAKSSGADPTSQAYKAGQVAGNVQKVGVDLATMLIPAVGAEKILRGTRALQGLEKTGRAGQIGASVAANVGAGGVATAVGAVQDPINNLTPENIGTNAAIDASLGVAAPLLGNLVKAIRNTKNSKQLTQLLESSDEITGTARAELDALAKSGASGKQFSRNVESILAKDAEITAVNPSDDLIKDLRQVDITDPNISQEDKIRAMAAGDDSLNGQALEAVPQPQRQLPATSESSTDIQRQLDDLYAGNYADDLYDITAKDGAAYTAEDASKATQRQIALLTKQRDDLLKQVDSEGVGSETAMGRIADIEQQIDGIKNGDSSALSQIFGEGTSRDINPQRLRELVKDLTNRRNVSASQEAADTAFKNENTFTASGRNSDDIAKELDDLRNGVPSDDLMVQQADFTSLDDVTKRIPQLQDRADDITFRKTELEHKLEDVLTPEKADSVKGQIDAKYEKMRAQFEGMSPTRAKYEMKKIDADHIDELSKVDEDLAADAEKAADLTAQLRAVQAEESDVLLRANYIKSASPDRFRVVDPEKQAEKIIQLEKDKVVADRFPGQEETDSVITNALAKTESPKQFEAKLDNDEAVKKSLDQKIESAQELSFKSTKPGFNILSTPLAVLRRAGARGNAIADEILEAHLNYSTSRGMFVDKAGQWSRDLKQAGKGADTRVFAKLNGEDVKLSLPEQKVADQIRSYLDERALQLGLTDQTKLQNYIPHMFEQSFGKNYNELEKIAAKIRYGVDEAGKKISKAEQEALAKSISNVDAESLAFIRSNNSWKVKNGFLNKREGAEGYSQDLFKVLSSYDNIANKKIFYEPALRFANGASEGMNREFQDYLVKFMGKIKGDNSSTFEHTLDRFVGEGNTAKILSGQRRLSNASIMGASPLTWVKNLQDMSKVFADRDLGEVVKAMPFAAKAMKYGTAENRMLFRDGIMESNQASFLKGMSLDQSVTKSGKAKTAALKTEQALWSGMRATDAFTRALNYQAAIGEFAKKNKSFPALMSKSVDSMTDAEKKLYDEGLKYVQKSNRDTVFTFSDIDIPVGLNNSIGRSTLNMQTYNLQTAKYIMKKFGDVLEKTDNGYKLSPKGLVKLSKYVAANVAFMGTIGAALGLKLEEMVPFGNEFADGNLPQSPLVSQLIGNDYQKGLIPTAGATVSELYKVATGQDNKLGEALGDSGEALGNFAASHIPGRTQFERTRKGVESVATGEARSNSGNIQFNQDEDPLNALMATVFGKNTTDAGKKWKSEGSRTLSPEQMRLGTKTADGVSIDSLSPKDRAMYVDFYNVVNNANPYDFDTSKDLRTTTSSRAKALVGEGNVNGAFREVKAYNDEVASKLREFVKQYGEENLPNGVTKQIEGQFIDFTDLVPEEEL